MTRFVTVAQASEIAPGEREIFDVEGYYVAVFNVGGTYYAIEDVCSHDDGPVAEGDLFGYEIECPAARRALRHSQRQSHAHARRMPIRWFPTRVEGNDLQVGFED